MFDAPWTPINQNHICLIYRYKQDLALSNLQWLICRKTQTKSGDTEYFDIVAEVLKRDTLAPYLFIICLDYVLRTSIGKIREKGFELTKKRSRRYPAKTITDADYADGIALLTNTPNQAETLRHSLERAAAGICYVLTCWPGQKCHSR